MIRSITAMLAAFLFVVAAPASADAQSVAKYPPGLLSANNSQNDRIRSSNSDEDRDGVVEASSDQADVMLQKEIDLLTMERRQLLVQFGIGHPTIQLYDAKIKAATRALASIEQRNRSQDDKGSRDTDVDPETSTKATTDQAESIAQLRRAVINLAKRVAALETQIKEMAPKEAAVDDLFE